MDGTPFVNLGNLVTADRLFDIPLYQRSYAWERKNLEDLWDDLYYLDDSKQHYFGTVLLKDSGKTAEVGAMTFERLDVIDGQQRLTTILILMREVISQMKNTSDETIQRQLSLMEGQYLKQGSHYKLNLLDGDGNFFQILFRH